MIDAINILKSKEMKIMSTQKSNGFYFSEEIGFTPKTKKNENKKKGDKKDDKKDNKKNK